MAYDQYPAQIGFADSGLVDRVVSAANPLPVTSAGGGAAVPGGTGQSATMMTNGAGAGTTGTDITWTGGDGTIEVDNTTGGGLTFNGTTVVAQFKSNSTGNWNAMGGACQFASPGSAVFNYPPGTHIRLLLSGGTPTGINGSVKAN